MCGIAGIYNLNHNPINDLNERLKLMSSKISHRGPDDSGVWMNDEKYIGFSHRRLSIIDLNNGHQPMIDDVGNSIVYNGEIYNYQKVKPEIKGMNFKTNSDTEVILLGYRKFKEDIVQKLDGMFAFAIWDEDNKSLFCSRDRLGMKPFYYAVQKNILYFASEAKAILPFVKSEINEDALCDYIYFQNYFGDKTLFKNIYIVPPANNLLVKNGKLHFEEYWKNCYSNDIEHTSHYFLDNVQSLFVDSVNKHTVSDVPIGVYLSGGIDSSSILGVAHNKLNLDLLSFSGYFSEEGFSEIEYARTMSRYTETSLIETNISSSDFVENIYNIIYHLDYPLAGPGSFSQYMVAQKAKNFRKVILGGQGGDEIFGGYTRYLIAYFEQCIKAAINGNSKGNFVLNYNTILDNLSCLQNYIPLLKLFWSDGLFDPMNERYFKLFTVNKSIRDIFDIDLISKYDPLEKFNNVFFSNNVGSHTCYFDMMANFDFKVLLPSLLQVEDRMSMAHGIESRLPFLDYKLIELSSTIPADIKFAKGDMKHIFKKSMTDFLPPVILDRKDKMGFSTPINLWFNGEIKDFVFDILKSQSVKEFPFWDYKLIDNILHNNNKFDRRLWGILSIAIWNDIFSKDCKYD